MTNEYDGPESIGLQYSDDEENYREAENEKEKAVKKKAKLKSLDDAAWPEVFKTKQELLERFPMNKKEHPAVVMAKFYLTFAEKEFSPEAYSRKQVIQILTRIIEAK